MTEVSAELIEDRLSLLVAGLYSLAELIAVHIVLCKELLAAELLEATAIIVEVAELACRYPYLCRG